MMAADVTAATGVDYGVNTLRVAPAAIAAAFGDAPGTSKHYVVHDVPVGTLETFDSVAGQWRNPTTPPASGAPTSLMASLRSRVITPTTPVRWTASHIDANTNLPLKASAWDGSTAFSSQAIVVKTPGVYISEIGAVNAFVPVPTGIPLFLGSGTTSTTNPVMLTAANDLGALVPGAGPDITQAVDYFFASGGQQAMVMTVGVAASGLNDGASADNNGIISLMAMNLTTLLANLPPSISADLVVVPAMGEASVDEFLALATAMVEAAATIEGMALLDPPTSLVQQAAANPTSWGELASLTLQLSGPLSSPAHAAIYSSPLMGPSPYLATPASVAVAAVIAQTDAVIGTWGPPAGPRAVLPARPLLEPSVELAGSLMAVGINPLMLQRNDTPVVWGDRTLSTEMPGRYIANTRTLATIHKTIQQGLQSYVFEPNDNETWLSVIRSVSNYLTTLWNAGGLPGDRASDAFSVNVGLGSTMTSQDLLNGLMRVNVSVAVAEPGVFVTQNFVLDMGKRAVFQ